MFTGRLVRQGDSIGVQVDLINVADGSQIWGYHYDQKLSDLMTLAENISGKISERLQLKLSASEQKSLSRGRTENQEAFRLYLLGRYHWNQRLDGRPGTVEKAIGYFQQAIEKDPLYAMAYVGMSEAYATLPSYSQTPARDAAIKGKAAARKALEIDDTVSEAYVALASIAADEWEWPEAGKAFQRALELNRGYATVHQWYATYLDAMGRPREALAEAQQAYELDPLSPSISIGLGAAWYHARQYERAIEQFRKTLELNPDFGAVHLHSGVVRLAQGKPKEALLDFNRAKALMPGSPPLALIGYAQAQLGNRQAALELLRQISDPAKRQKGTGFELAVLYMGLGDKDRAFEYLNQACDERAPLMVLLKVDPLFAPLRSDRRYVSLLRRMNLTP